MMYETLEDVSKDVNARVCTWTVAMTNILLEYSMLWDKLYNEYDLFNALGTDYSNDTCNVIIIPVSDFEIFAEKDPSLCDESEILPTSEFFVTIETVFYISHHFQYANEIIEAFDKYIDNGWYNVIFERNFQKLAYNNFDINEFEKFEESINGERNLARASIYAASSSSPGSQETGEETYISSSCPSDPNENTEAVTLDIAELSFPILITFFCTTLGLICHWTYNCKSSYRDKRIGTKESSTVDHCKSTISTERSKKYIFNAHTNDASSRKSFSDMSTSDLVKKLQSTQGLSAHDKCAALELLPDRSGIIDLLFDNKALVVEEEENALMESLTLFELQYIAFNAIKADRDSNNSEDLNDLSPLLWENSLESDNPKQGIIELIMRNAYKKDLALTLAKSKEAVYEKETSTEIMSTMSKPELDSLPSFMTQNVNEKV